MLEQLNNEQRAAVTTEAQHILVLAGAGSGKTKVLTSRMAWLIQQGLSPASLMAVTFTNKAAKEMLSRLSAITPLNTRSMWIGTFHGLCNRMLRMHYRDAGLPQQYQILDSGDQQSAIKRLLKTHSIDVEKFPFREVQRFINSHKEKGERATDIQAWDPHSAKLVELYQLYDEQCQREGVVDFTELLLRCYELLSRNQLIREHYQRRFQHILIDEFQDTNDLQYRWLCLLGGGGAFLFAVGDDDQSIYAFRGANVDNMMAFERDYAKGNIVRLEQNYRSYGHILNSANALIKHNPNRLGKALWTERGEGEPVRIMELESEQEEARWVTDEIRSLLREGVEQQEVAILYRSNAQSRALEHAMFNARIPYRVYGGTRFYERQEIKHVMAYLRLIASIDDDTSFLRVVNFPARGIGARTVETLSDHAREIGCSLANAVGAVSGRGGNSLASFIALIHSMRSVAEEVTLPELIQHVIEHSGLQLHYENEREGQDRLDNLEELVNAAQVFAFEENFEGKKALEMVKQVVADVEFAVEESNALAEFLSHASLESGDNQADRGEEAVQLMTIHAAKGLEFNVVFLTGLEEGLFPHENSLLEEGGLEEERRLMYVAITRARERLYITMARSRMIYGQSRYAVRSSFLDEMPEEAQKWLSPKDVSYYSAPRGPSSWSGGSVTGRSSGAGLGGGFPGGTVGAGRAGFAKAPVSSGVQVGDKLFKIGQTVSHSRFGQGVVMQLQGQGTDATARIFFSEHGEKTLALGVAKLDIV